MTTAFDFDAGLYQGRIAGPNGSFVYELGHAVPGQQVELEAGDGNRVTQTADWSGVPIARATVTVRMPPTLTLGTQWLFTALIEAAVYTSVVLTRDVTFEAALPTGVVAGTNISFALTLTGDAGALYSVELPSVQIEQVVPDATTATIVLGTLLPAKGDAGVPVDAKPIITLLGAGASPSVTFIYVDGFLAIGGGATQGGWGITQLSSGPDSVVLQLAPPALWAPATTHTIRVMAGALDQSYSFTIVDTLAPAMTGATATDSRSVRVTWSKALAQLGTYVLSVVAGAPAVTPKVLSAAVQADGSVLLALDIDQTRGATYSVAVSGATDLLGNESLDPLYAYLGAVAPTVQFTGWTCPRTPAGREFNLYELGTLDRDRELDQTGDLKQFVAIYQETTDLLLSKADRFLADAVDPDTAVEAWLDRMLVDLGNPFPFDLDVVGKRKLVQLLVPIYKLKGTDPGIIYAIQFFMGLDVTIAQPWVQGWRLGLDVLGVSTNVASGLQRDLYSYNIVCPVVLTPDQQKTMTSIARYMQRAQCHLRTIVQPTPPPASPNHWQLGLSQLGVNTVVHQ